MLKHSSTWLDNLSCLIKQVKSLKFRVVLSCGKIQEETIGPKQNTWDFINLMWVRNQDKPFIGRNKCGSSL